MRELSKLLSAKQMSAEAAAQVLEKIIPMLRKVSTYEDLKQISDFSRACRIYSELKANSGTSRNLAAQTYIRAEKKLGEILAKQPPMNGRAGAEGKMKTYARLGITKMRASRSQQLAGLGEDEFEGYLETCDQEGIEPSMNGALSFTSSHSEIRRSMDSMRRFKKKADADFSSIFQLCSGNDFSIMDGINVDAVITAAPARGEILSMIAEQVKKVPVVAVLTTQVDIGTVVSSMDEHLEFRWIMALETETAPVDSAKVNSAWRPVVVFGKPREWMRDHARKESQSELSLQQLFARTIFALTKENDVVFDPFVEGGECAVASVGLSRRFAGCVRGSKTSAEIEREAKACLQSHDI